MRRVRCSVAHSCSFQVGLMCWKSVPYLQCMATKDTMLWPKCYHWEKSSLCVIKRSGWNQLSQLASARDKHFDVRYNFHTTWVAVNVKYPQIFTSPMSNQFLSEACPMTEARMFPGNESAVRTLVLAHRFLLETPVETNLSYNASITMVLQVQAMCVSVLISLLSLPPCYLVWNGGGNWQNGGLQQMSGSCVHRFSRYQ